jgi:hypothetical protein
MGIVFGVLRLACVILFTLSVPLMVRARFRNPEFPAWRLILLAIALGWIFPFAHKMLERPMHQELDREERVAAEEYMRHPPPPIKNADGSWETVVDDPYGIGDWIAEDYHPVESLLYGPAYLLVCWFAAWVFFRRSSFEARSRMSTYGDSERFERIETRRFWLISGAVLLTFWIAIVGYVIKPPEIFSDGILINGWNLFFGPQLTLPLALLTAWLLVGWLPSALGRSLGRKGKQ